VKIFIWGDITANVWGTFGVMFPIFKEMQLCIYRSDSWEPKPSARAKPIGLGWKPGHLRRANKDYCCFQTSEFSPQAFGTVMSEQHLYTHLQSYDQNALRCWRSLGLFPLYHCSFGKTTPDRTRLSRAWAKRLAFWNQQVRVLMGRAIRWQPLNSAFWVRGCWHSKLLDLLLW